MLAGKKKFDIEIPILALKLPTKIKPSYGQLLSL